MHLFRRIAKPVSGAVIASLLALGIHFPAAQAALVGTDTVVQAAAAQHQRERLQDLFTRTDVRDKLVALGVDPAQVQARVDALTDEEVARLAERIDALPAGGDGLSSILNAALVVFLVLLITDLLGLTDVFSFTRKGSARADR